MQRLLNFLKKIYTYRSMIRAMALREIQARYIGTLGGLAWSIINPLMFILVYWIVFSVGFRVHPDGGVAFIVVFLCGFIPWSTFAEALTTSTQAISANSHLVTKTVFPTEILPIVNITASLITHSVMLGVFLVVMLFNKIAFSVYDLQFLYYLSGLIVFSLGLGWFLSAVNVFYKDVGQIVSVVLNVWFWLTPIVWLQSMVPMKYMVFLKLNPMYYIVDGYKSSFIYHSPVWHNPVQGVYFWTVSVAVFAAGALTFRKLKPEFAEVL
jgi:ABC-type polysaccharide/polyol phosphate export permease